MILWLVQELREYFPPLRVFRYVSFRVIMAMLSALAISFVLHPWFIRRLQSRQIGQVVRDDGPESHYSKAGTPTMGGALVIFSMVIPTVLWAELSNPFIWAALTVTISFAAIGFVDDYLKLRYRNTKGLSGRYKLLLQFGLSGAVFYVMSLQGGGLDTKLYLPFVSAEKFSLDLPLFVFIGFATFVVAGTSNAVNLTDGLDGLAIGPTMIAAAAYMILAYCVGTALQFPITLNGGEMQYMTFNFAEYLKLPHVAGASELAVFASTIIGAGIGFLWFNTFPAQVFMGDVGSLSLGGALGMLAVLTKNELLSVILCGLFVVEALSVIIQTTSFKLTGKRVFRMAPIHHHFEKLGWQEPKIVVRFWIVSIMLALVALASLKLR
ncbi:MAG: phospho-N-acetylmuramoyl-pentapeptide-transferase [Bradymonadia bacterium]